MKTHFTTLNELFEELENELIKANQEHSGQTKIKFEENSELTDKYGDAAQEASEQFEETLRALNDDNSDEEYCIHCHNDMLISQVINNTLSGANNIEPRTADTLLKLAELQLRLRQLPSGE
jgi:hypothetical protein